MITTVAITESWPMGHRLQAHDGACRGLHGHTYRLQVTFEGPIEATGPSSGMIADFSVLKSEVRGLLADLDHALVLQLSDPAIDAVRSYAKLVTVKFPPTVERLAEWLYREIVTIDRLPTCSGLTLWESDTTFARVTP
jgi:6-pyruvoyltetrahydropterin/6-carboxytetrahydropterin synthase